MNVEAYGGQNFGDLKSRFSQKWGLIGIEVVNTFKFIKNIRFYILSDRNLEELQSCTSL